MLVVNTETLPGYQVTEIKGLVQGNTVRAKHAGRDIAAGFKNLVGGELKGYTELLTESRREAVERMLAQAQQLGANAVINVRFSTSAVTGGAAELYAYGTAVVVVTQGGAPTSGPGGQTLEGVGGSPAAQASGLAGHTLGGVGSDGGAHGGR